MEDGNKLVVGNAYPDQNKTDVFDVVNNTLVFSVQGGSGFVDWSPDGGMIASGSVDGNVYGWDASSGTPLFVLLGHTASINEVNWSPNSSKLASASDDGTVRIWDVTTGQQIHIIQDDDRVYTVDWSPDGSKLAYGGMGGVVHIIDVPEDQKQNSTVAPVFPTPNSQSPDGTDEPR